MRIRSQQGVGLFFVLLGCIDAALGAQASSQNTCTRLSLQPTGKISSQDEQFYKALEEFERSFAEHRRSAFADILHPALQQNAAQKFEIFESTVQDFGLEKAKLTRSSVFQLRFNGTGTEIQCAPGKVRGVVGPKEQYAVMHTFSGGSEQIRLFTLFAPIVPSQVEQYKTKYKTGLVMMHGQAWTHERKNAEALLEDAKKWGVLGESLVAWLVAESARRIVTGNPYFEPENTAAITREAEAFKVKVTEDAALRQKMPHSGIDWEFLEFSPVFQASGIEVGLRFRTKAGEDVAAQMEKCKKASAFVAKEYPQLRLRFRGLECLAWGPEENLTKAPGNGSQFFPWKDLKLN